MSQVVKYSPPSAFRPEGGGYTQPLAPVIDCTPGEPSLPWTEYLRIVRRQVWKIVIFVALCTGLTYVVSVTLKPRYRATAVIDIDRTAPASIVGEDLNRRVESTDLDEFIWTQVRLIQSNSVLRPVVEKYRLLVSQQKTEGGNSLTAQGELAGPIDLPRLSVKRQPYTYLISISYESSDPKLAADVANAVANSYIEQTFDIRARSSAGISSFMERQLDELKAKMERSSHALARFESELDLIDPVQKTNMLSSRLLQLNTEFTNAQVDRVKKQSTYKSMQSGSLEAAQVSGQGEELARLLQGLNEASQHFAEIKTIYGSGHPEYQKAASQVSELQKQVTETRRNIFDRVALDYREAIAREQMLQREVANTKADFDRLNGKSFEYQRLLEEAAADKKLYEELVAKIKEAGINVGFQNNNVRLADLALAPVRPVFPKVTVNVLAALFLSSILGAISAIVRETTNATLQSASEATRDLGARVIGTLPVAKGAPGLPIIFSKHNAGAKTSRPHDNGTYAQLSPFEEAVRALRNSIVLSSLTQNINSVLITSPGVREGKTTTAVNLAIAYSAQGRRTLLIDADLRRPSVHRVLNVSSKTGLADVLNGEQNWKDACVPVPQQPHLDVMLAGNPTPNAADLVGVRLNDLLDEFATEYDLVLLDSAPFIGFAEALQAAAAVNGVLIVASAGNTSRKALELMLTSLNWLQANVLGIVLNRSKEDSGRNYGYNACYRNSRSVLGIPKERIRNP